jgi:hypothetical protein
MDTCGMLRYVLVAGSLRPAAAAAPAGIGATANAVLSAYHSECLRSKRSIAQLARRIADASFLPGRARVRQVTHAAVVHSTYVSKT